MKIVGYIDGGQLVYGIRHVTEDRDMTPEEMVAAGWTPLVQHDRKMAEQLAEVEAIANNPAPATFENTIVAMERSGR